MNVPLHILVILVALVGSAFYAGMETGVVSINRIRLQHMVRRRIPGAEILQAFLDHPDHLLGTTLVGNNLCNVTASVLAVSTGAELYGPAGYTAAYVLLTIVTLLFCEYLPKAWFQAAPSRRTLPLARFLQFNGRLFYPFSRMILALTRLLVPIRTKHEIWQPKLTRDEFSHLTQESTRSGSLSTVEAGRMHRVLDLARKTCRDIMTPRDAIVYVSDDATAESLLEQARTANRTRLPVYVPEENRFIGTVYIFDVLDEADPSGKTARDFMRPPQFVGQDQPADRILPRMRRSQQPLALVTDTHSNVVGLVTTEDVLEEIIGPMGTYQNAQDPVPTT